MHSIIHNTPSTNVSVACDPVQMLMPYTIDIIPPNLHSPHICFWYISASLGHWIGSFACGDVLMLLKQASVLRLIHRMCRGQTLG